MSTDYYTVHELTEWGPSDYSYLHYSSTFDCWCIHNVPFGGRMWVEGGYRFHSLDDALGRINLWRSGPEYRDDIDIVIVHHVLQSEIVREISAGESP